MNLYELSGSYIQLQNILEDMEDEDIAAALDEVNDSFENKAINTVKMIKAFEADAKAVKEEKQRLGKRQKTLENKAQSLKDYIYDNMKATHKDKIKSDLFNISIRKNPPALDIHSEEAIPAEFYIEQKPKLDKQKLKEYVKEYGLDGVELKQGESLSIR